MHLALLELPHRRSFCGICCWRLARVIDLVLVLGLQHIFMSAHLLLEIFQHFGNCLLGWFDLGKWQIDVHIRQFSDDRLKFRIIDPVQRFDYFQSLLQGLVFWDLGLRRSMMLLVAEQNMVKKRAVAGQE